MGAAGTAAGGGEAETELVVSFDTTPDTRPSGVVLDAQPEMVRQARKIAGTAEKRMELVHNTENDTDASSLNEAGRMANGSLLGNVESNLYAGIFRTGVSFTHKKPGVSPPGPDAVLFIRAVSGASSA